METPLRGVQVDEEDIQAMNRVFQEASSGMASQAFRDSHRVLDISKDVESSGVPDLLIGYRHPIHSFKDWTVHCSLSDAVEFLADRIDTALGNGMDLFIASVNFGCIWVTTHDGDAYRLK